MPFRIEGLLAGRRGVRALTAGVKQIDLGIGGTLGDGFGPARNANRDQVELITGGDDGGRGTDDGLPCDPLNRETPVIEAALRCVASTCWGLSRETLSSTTAYSPS